MKFVPKKIIILLITMGLNSTVDARDFGAGFGTGTVFGLTTGALLGAATSSPRETVVIREQAPTQQTTRIVSSRPSSGRSSSILDELNDLHNQVDNLSDDLADADDTIANLRDKIANLKAENKVLASENKELRTKITQLKSDKKALEQKQDIIAQPQIIIEPVKN